MEIAVSRPSQKSMVHARIDQPDGRVLYLIGRLLPRDRLGVTDQIAFDRKILATGIADEEGRGPSYDELNELLRQRGTKAGFTT